MDSIGRRGTGIDGQQASGTERPASGAEGGTAEITEPSGLAARVQSSQPVPLALQQRSAEPATAAALTTSRTTQSRTPDPAYARLGLSAAQVERFSALGITAELADQLMIAEVPVAHWLDIQSRVGTAAMSTFVREYFVQDDDAGRNTLLRAYGADGAPFVERGYTRDQAHQLMTIGVSAADAAKCADADVTFSEMQALFAFGGVTAETVFNLREWNSNLDVAARKLKALLPVQRSTLLRAMGPDGDPYLTHDVNREQAYELMLAGIGHEDFAPFKRLGFDVQKAITHCKEGGSLATANAAAQRIFQEHGLDENLIRGIGDVGMPAERVDAMVRAGIAPLHVVDIYTRATSDQLDHLIENFPAYGIEDRQVGIRIFGPEGDGYIELGFDHSDAAQFVTAGLSPKQALDAEYERLGLPVDHRLTGLAAVPRTPLRAFGHGKFNQVFIGKYSWAGGAAEETIFKPLQPPDPSASTRLDGSWVGPKTGVDRFDPKFAQRNLTAVAVQKLGQKALPAGSGIVIPSVYPKTGLALQGDQPKLGLVMEFAAGVSAYHLRSETLHSPEFCRQATWLQVWDQVLGQSDRHASNYIVHAKPDGSMRLIGIDNDQCCGTVGDPRQMVYQHDKNHVGFRGVGLPPVLDTEMAMVLERLDVDEMRDIIGSLLPRAEAPSALGAAAVGTSPTLDAAEAAVSRLKVLRDQVAQLRKSGLIIAANEWGSDKAVAALRDPWSSYVGREWLPKPPALPKEARVLSLPELL